MVFKDKGCCADKIPIELDIRLVSCQVIICQVWLPSLRTLWWCNTFQYQQVAGSGGACHWNMSLLVDISGGSVS